MKILVIDDERTFIFSEDDEVVYARNLYEAREFLLNEHWDEVWLDHDLGNGEDVSKLTNEIEASRIVLDVDWFYIHTMNPVGRDNIYHALKNAGYKLSIINLSINPDLLKGN